MKKWKKLLLPAMCVFMLQTPVIANAEVAGSDGAAAVVENPVAAPTPALLNGIIKKGSKTYYYKDGVMQKNCWSADKKQYFGKNGVAYAAPKESGYKSYHMLVTVPIFLSDRVVDTKVEIQIRTMAMDFWASLEHKIYYKFEGNAPQYISRDLRECSEIVSMLDAKMLQLNEAIIEARAAQEEDTDAV